MESNKRTTKQVIAEQQAINRKLWAKENGRLHHVDANKLIAEFMGIKLTENGLAWDYINNPIPSYHTSWDWLMPVVQKVSSLCDEPCELDNMKHALLTGDIESVYDDVVEFIKEYNDEKLRSIPSV